MYSSTHTSATAIHCRMPRGVMRKWQGLGGPGLAQDLPVGWAALPLCDGEGDIASGRFRVPMARGEVDPSMDRYLEVEEEITVRNASPEDMQCSLVGALHHPRTYPARPPQKFRRLFVASQPIRRPLEPPFPFSSRRAPGHNARGRSRRSGQHGSPGKNPSARASGYESKPTAPESLPPHGRTPHWNRGQGCARFRQVGRRARPPPASGQRRRSRISVESGP